MNSPNSSQPNQLQQPSPTTWRWWVRLVVQPLLFLALLALAVSGLGLAQRLGWLSSSGTSTGSAASNDATTQYICPMMCTPPQNEPGRCPVCGMELVPATQSAGAGDGRSIVIDPVARRIAGIETTEVASVPLVRQLRAVGKLAYDQSGLKTLAAYVDGRIERLFADYTGVEVQRGDRLAVLYSPELYSAQVEYLSVQKNRFSSGRRNGSGVNNMLAESTRERLIEMGMLPHQIDELESTGKAQKRLDLIAEITGTVIEKLATEGDYVATGQKIYRLADLSSVWLMLELFPEDAAHIRYGQRVTAEVQSLAGETYLGRVAFIDPTVDPETRTVGVRVVIPNPQGQLRVGDFATAHIEIPLGPSGAPVAEIYDAELAGKWISPRHPHVVAHEPGPCPVCGIAMVAADKLGFVSQPLDHKAAVGVPRRSVLRAGKTSLVYVEREPGKFEPRRVTLGPNIGDTVVVLKGLEAGERVAVSGNFLIDSQMQLAGNPSLIDPNRIAEEPRDPAGGPVQFTAKQMAEIEKLGEADQQLALEQQLCPVTLMPLGSMGQPGVVEVDQRRVLICCEGCRSPLLNESEKYLFRLDEHRHEHESERGHESEREHETESEESSSADGASSDDLPPIAAPAPFSEASEDDLPPILPPTSVPSSSGNNGNSGGEGAR